jgi:hypothetical protein
MLLSRHSLSVGECVKRLGREVSLVRPDHHAQLGIEACLGEEGRIEERFEDRSVKEGPEIDSLVSAVVEGKGEMGRSRDVDRGYMENHGAVTPWIGDSLSESGWFAEERGAMAA